MLIKLILFPFKLVMILCGYISGFLFSLFGSIITILLGLAMLIAGVVLSVSVIGLFAGIPLVFIGLATILKGIIG